MTPTFVSSLASKKRISDTYGLELVTLMCARNKNQRLSPNLSIKIAQNRQKSRRPRRNGRKQLPWQIRALPRARSLINSQNDVKPLWFFDLENRPISQNPNC